jgi:hypothetical protein
VGWREIIVHEIRGWPLPLFQARGWSMISEHAIIRLVWLCSFLPPCFGIERHRKKGSNEDCSAVTMQGVVMRDEEERRTR